jgi:uncharacterized protein YndB with AHSA1/START domain
MAADRQSRVDSASLVIAAPRHVIYAACLDRTALTAWLPPKTMTGRIDTLEPWEGGRFRMVLSYTSDEHLGGKTTSNSDVVQGRYVSLVQDETIVQAIRFESADPKFGGEMTMTWALSDVRGGTQVSITCKGVPEGISPEEHAHGLNASLENLSRFVDPEEAA